MRAFVGAKGSRASSSFPTKPWKATSNASRKATPGVRGFSALSALVCCNAANRSAVGDLLNVITLALGAAFFLWKSYAAVVITTPQKARSESPLKQMAASIFGFVLCIVIKIEFGANPPASSADDDGDVVSSEQVAAMVDGLCRGNVHRNVVGVVDGVEPAVLVAPKVVVREEVYGTCVGPRQ